MKKNPTDSQRKIISMIVSQLLFTRSVVLLFSLATAVTSCNISQSSFVRLSQAPAVSDPETRHFHERPRLSDALALNYADLVATSFRAQGYGNRLTRETSSSAQVTLAALSGVSPIFGFSQSASAVLGLTSASIPNFQKIFKADERAKVYHDATRLIEEAIVEYLSLNQDPSSQYLTQNGVSLIQRTTASIHVVEKALTGSLPTIEDMNKATEAMSRAGAVPTLAGSPAFNNIVANERAAEIARAKEVQAKYVPPSSGRLEYGPDGKLRLIPHKESQDSPAPASNPGTSNSGANDRVEEILNKETQDPPPSGGGH